MRPGVNQTARLPGLNKATLAVEAAYFLCPSVRSRKPETFHDKRLSALALRQDNAVLMQLSVDQTWQESDLGSSVCRVTVRRKDTPTNLPLTALLGMRFGENYDIQSTCKTGAILCL
jgi:hypothetical protein